MNVYRLMLTALCSVSLPLAAAGAEFAAAKDGELSPEQIDAYARQTIDAFNITGMSITVVTKDSIIFQQSYGLRDVTQSAPVDKNTIFPFGSVGKAFTTAALATLVDEGKLGWDDPVRKYIPEFEMSDPYISAEFTVRDLLTHRSGLPLGAGDLLVFPDGALEVKDALAVFKTIQPATSFRSQFAYDNLMYIVAGDVLARIDGRSWANALAARLFKPLGMKSCQALPSKAAKAKNTVTQHTRELGGVAAKPLDPRYILADGAAAAGGISCSIADLSKWAQFWLRDGKTASGKVLISSEQVDQLWTGVTPARASADGVGPANTHFSIYGLGWSLSDFYGELLVSHGGGLLGAVSYFALLPEKDVAVFFVTNDFVPYVSGLARQILSDVAAPEADTDWIADAAANYSAYLATAKKDAGLNDDQPADVETPPVRPLSDYAGTYNDPWYGETAIDIRDGRLFIDMSRSEALDAPLVSVAPDKFVARWPDRTLNADAYVIFEVEDDRVTGMTMQAVSRTTDFSFDFHDLRFTKGH